MHEVTCTHCGRSVEISPDAPRCTQCGLDLQSQIPTQVAAGYFYRRSADLAARGDVESALAEAERGLGFAESSELRLLAAILSKRLGDPDSVRVHVAAIPVDDRLRQEAEWLVRAQVAPRPDVRQPLVAEQAKPVKERAREGGRPSPFEGTTIASEEAAAVERAAARPLPAPVAWTQRLWGMVALLLVLVAGAMGWLLLSGGPDALLALLPGLAPAAEQVETVDALQPDTPAPLQLPTPTPQGTPTVPPEFVTAPESEPVAAAAPALSAAALDLDALLVASGRADLAQLDLLADLQADSVRITGVVTNTADRQVVIDTVRATVGVTDISAAELLVRLPPTYAVQPGDTLWQIVERFYGSDPERLPQLLELNRDILPSAELLQVGMDLRLPPID